MLYPESPLKLPTDDKHQIFVTMINEDALCTLVNERQASYRELYAHGKEKKKEALDRARPYYYLRGAAIMLGYGNAQC